MIDYSIYPKQFRNSRIPIEKNRCFVLMPFNSRFDEIYGQIKKRLLDSDYTCNRADELFGSVPIMGNILEEILRAHFVIADLTGQNANVFYELGIAHSFKDAQNIVLISQGVSDIPFDIRHLSTIIYDETNIKYLTSSVLRVIRENSKYYSFFEALQKKSVIDLIHEDQAEFLEIYRRYFGPKITAATDILNGDTDRYKGEDVKKVLDSSLGVFYAAAADGSRKNLHGIMRIIGALLSHCEDYEYAHEVTKHLLHEIKLENYPIGQNEIISLQSDLAIGLAAEKAYFSETMSWIIEYFSRSKSATVDLNRYNLEKFLLTSTDLEVDSIIVNSVLHDNYYVREHMADIVGEKRIISGVDALTTQLKREDNVYVCSSLITALGKLGDRRAYRHIADWFGANRDQVIRTQHYFILKHIYIALAKLDKNNPFTAAFENEFAEHVTAAAIY